MRLSSKAIAACALLSFSPLTFAEVYFGGSGVLSATQEDNMKAGFGGKAFLGFRPESIPMTFEAGYLTSGKNDFENSYIDQFGNIYTDLNLSVKGGFAALGYYGRFGRTGSGGFAKLGYFSGKSKLAGNQNGFSGSDTKNTSGAMLSGGIDWMLTHNFGFRFGLDALIGINDYRDLDRDHKGVMTLASAGVVFAFGGSEPAPRHQSAPVYAPAVSAPTPAPYIAPAPAPQVYEPVVAAPVAVPVTAAAQAPAASSPSVGSAQLVPGAVLRTGPSMKSEGLRTLPDGGEVKLLKRETNAEGPWWSVQLADGTTGWMIEWGLTRISKR